MNLKFAAAQAIADVIVDAIAALGANTQVGEDEADTTAEYPALRVIPERMEFEPHQAEALERDEDADDIADYEMEEVGSFNGTLELRLYCNSRPQREAFEQQILQLFLSTEGAPGSLPTTIPDVVLSDLTTLYAAPIVAYLDGEDWREELVFGKKRMSFLSLSFSYPALVIRGAYDLDSVRVEIATSLEADAPEEAVEVQEDGTALPIAVDPTP